MTLEQKYGQFSSQYNSRVVNYEREDWPLIRSQIPLKLAVIFFYNLLDKIKNKQKRRNF